MPLRRLIFVVLVTASSVICTFLFADDVQITLNHSFIEKYKNRVTIDADFVVDKAHPKPNPPANDGDLHIAGRSSAEIQLPIVAEIMNAALHEDAIIAIHAAEQKNADVHLTGAWRLWCEHAGEPQTQGESLSKFNTTNPDHVFEIHPLTQVENINLISSLVPIQGFKTKDAEGSFITYENKKARIIPGSSTSTLYTPMAGYNYVEFILQAYTDDQFVVADGRFIFANVQDLEGNFLAYKRRMAFVKDSEPEAKVKSLKKGECLHVLGIPRFNLALLSWRIRHAADRPEALTWNLPYEMVVVGVYEDLPACSEWN